MVLTTDNNNGQHVNLAKSGLGGGAWVGVGVYERHFSHFPVLLWLAQISSKLLFSYQPL